MDNYKVGEVVKVKKRPARFLGADRVQGYVEIKHVDKEDNSIKVLYKGDTLWLGADEVSPIPHTSYSYDTLRAVFERGITSSIEITLDDGSFLTVVEPGDKTVFLNYYYETEQNGWTVRGFLCDGYKDAVRKIANMTCPY